MHISSRTLSIERDAQLTVKMSLELICLQFLCFNCLSIWTQWLEKINWYHFLLKVMYLNSDFFYQFSQMFNQKSQLKYFNYSLLSLHVKPKKFSLTILSLFQHNCSKFQQKYEQNTAREAHIDKTLSLRNSYENAELKKNIKLKCYA